MKKILFLFVALIMSVMGAKAGVVGPATGFTGYSNAPVGGSWAANTQWFMIKNTKDNSSENFYLTPSGNYLPKNLPTAANIDSYLWALVGDAENGFQLYNKAQGANLILWATSSSRGMSEAPTNSHVWDLYTSLADGKYLFIEHGTEHNAFNNNQQAGTLVTWNSDGALYGWQHTAEDPQPGGDGGSNFVISGAEEYTVEVNGLSDGGGVIIAGENHGVGPVNTFGVLAEAATAIAVDGYDADLSLSGKTFTVNYTEHVSNFPEAGTYFVTFKGQKSDRYNCLYNDMTQAEGYTFQSQNFPTPIEEHNNYIWKVVSDGNGHFTSMANGQGGSYAMQINSDGKKPQIQALDYEAHTFNGKQCYYLKITSNSYVSGSPAIKSGHNCLNVANSNFMYNGLYTVTTWDYTKESGNAGDNNWEVSAIDMSALSEYAVTVTGAEAGYVSFGGQQAANGGFFLASSIAKGDLTAATISGYEPEITVADHTITVVYTLTATPAVVTYNYVIDDETVATETLNTFVDEVFPEPTKNFDGYTRGAKPEGTVATATETRNITLTWAGPFEPTTITGGDFAEGTKWYYMQNGLNNGNGYVYYLNDSSKKSAFNTTETNDPAYKWAFVRKAGTPYFYLYNKQTGAVAMGEQLSTDTGWAASHNQGFVVSEGGEDMPLELFTNGAGYGFRLAAVDGTCILGKHTDSKLSIWGNAANKGDNGSRFTFTVAPEDVVGKDWAAFEARYNALNAYPIGENLGEYADIEKYLEDWGSDVPFSVWKNYFSTTLTFKEEANYDADMENMQWFLDNMQINQPKAGSFLRMKGVVNNTKYLLGTKTSDGSKFSMGTAEDATSVFYYDGEHLLSYCTGLYVGTTSSKWQWNMGEGSAINFYDASTKGAYRVRVPKDSGDKDYVFLYSGAANAGNADRGGFATEGACTDTKYQWTLEEVTSLPVSVSAAGYATLYAPVALTVPTGVEAYTLAFDGTYLQATAVEGTIPANTGVVLKANAGSYDFAITTGGNATSVLSGTVPAKTKVDGALVLGLDEENNVGFYSLKEEVANLAGFKAYYVPTSGESNLRISFGELTSIISAAQQNGGQAIYDLQGRRVVSAKGISIVNGKKVIK